MPLSPRFRAAAITASLVLAGTSVAQASAARATRGGSPPGARGWVDSGALPAAPGLGLTRNEDGEPGMGVTPDGHYWVASDVAPYGAQDPRAKSGLLTGADIWTSSNHGKTYRYVGDPFAANGNSAGLAGEDTDLAVAQVKNSAGHYNIYAASLWVGASSLAVSADDGKTWTVNQLGGIVGQDRPWLSTDGACRVYLTYHQLPAFTPVVSTYDVCSPTGATLPVSTGAALDPINQTALTLSDFPGLSSDFNKPWVDTSTTSPHYRALYVPMSVCENQSAVDLVNGYNASTCLKGTRYLLARSTDGGQTFTYHPVALDPSGVTAVWGGTVASDAAGTLYYAWSDEHNAYLNVSTDGGDHWSRTTRLNSSGTTAVYPTVAAGKAGRVDIAWYGTNRSGNSNDKAVMGDPALAVNGKRVGAPWTVEVARSLDGGSAFHILTASAVIHYGELCTSGDGCADTDSRNLLDDFGLALDPTTGGDSTAYTSDRPAGDNAHAFTGFATITTAPRSTR